MHKKRYKQVVTGVELLCGNRVIADSPYRFSNFYIDGCIECGGFVQTIGDSPETDKVVEYTCI